MAYWNNAGGPRDFLARLGDGRFLPILATTGAGWVSRFATAAAQFIAIRLLTDRLGINGYGAFAVITGLLAWFMLADFGFGSAIQNHISHARVDGEAWTPVVRRVSEWIGLRLLVVWAAVACIAPLAGPYLLASYAGIPKIDAILAFGVFGILATATGALSIVLKMQFAQHRGYVSHLVTGGSAVAGLALLAITLSLNTHHTLAWAIIAYYSPGTFIPFVLLARSLGKAERNDTIPFSVKRQARVFLIFASLSALVLNVDYIILSRAVPAKQLLVYAIMSKVYALIFILYNSILQAYWPVSAEALRRGDAEAVRSSVRRCVAIGTAIVSVGTLMFIVTAKWISMLLAPAEHPFIPAPLLLLYAGYWLLRVWTDVFGTIIMSAGQVSYLCKIVPMQAAVSVPAAYVGAHLYGVPGLIAGLSLGYVVTVAWMMPRHVYRYLDRLSEVKK